MNTAKLLKDAEAGLNECERTITSLREDLRARDSTIAALQDAAAEARAASDRRIQSLTLELRQARARQPKLNAEEKVKLRLPLPGFTVLLHPEQKGYVDIFDEQEDELRPRDWGAAARQMVAEQPRSRVLTELLKPHQWSLSGIAPEAEDTQSTIEEAPTAVEESEQIMTSIEHEPLRADSAIATPPQSHDNALQRRAVCKHCYCHDKHCTGAAPACAPCAERSVPCVYLLCDHGARCWAETCYYIHPDQMEGGRKVEKGVLGLSKRAAKKRKLGHI